MKRIKSFIFLALFLFGLVNPLSIYAQTPHYSQNCPLIAAFWVEKGLEDFLKQRYNVNFDDWAQLQVDAWNKILKDSGAQDCYRRRAPIHVKDGALPLNKCNGCLSTNNPDITDRTVDVMWGFPANQQDSVFWDKVMKRWGGIDWGLIHELSHARYLVDEYRNDISADRVDVKDPLKNEPIVGRYLPIMQGNLVYLNKTQDIMGNHETDHYYGDYSKRALDRIAGQHTAPIVGGWNAPANLGIYLNNIPEKNYLQILDINGQPLEGAQIRIFQSTRSDDGKAYGKKFDNNPDITGITNTQGKIDVSENPFGYISDRKIFQSDVREKILPTQNNNMFILEVLYQGQLFYRFMEAQTFNYAYWDGAVKEATFQIGTTINGSNPSVLINTEDPNISFSPDTISQNGQILTINGKGFGDQVSTLSLVSDPVDSGPNLQANILRWTDKQIQAIVRVPQGLSGRIPFEINILPINGQKVLVPKEKLIYQSPNYKEAIPLKINISVTCGNDDTPMRNIKVVFEQMFEAHVIAETFTNDEGKAFFEAGQYNLEEGDWYQIRVNNLAHRFPIVKNTLQRDYSFRYPECPSAPQPTPSPTSQLVRTIISNYSDFRQENAQGDKGSSTKEINADVEWILSTNSPNQPIYVREEYSDQTIKDYEINLKDGETGEIGNIKIKAKVIKVPFEIIVNGNREDLPASSEDSIKIILTEEQRGLSQFDIPIEIKYSDGTSDYLVKHIILKSQAEQTYEQQSVPEEIQKIEEPSTQPESQPETFPSSDKPCPPDDQTVKCEDGVVKWWTPANWSPACEWVVDEEETKKWHERGECL